MFKKQYCVYLLSNGATAIGNNSIEVNINKETKGIYFVKVTSGETTNSVRIVRN